MRARALLSFDAMRARLVVIVAAVTLLAGCTRTETVPIRYWLPLEGNSRGPEAARTCASTCRVVHGADSPGFFSCLGMCPDIRIARGAACEDSDLDQPPSALCYTRLVEEEVFDPETAEFVLALLGRVVEAGVATALAADDHPSRGHEHHGGHEPSSRHASNPPRREHAPGHSRHGP